MFFDVDARRLIRMEESVITRSTLSGITGRVEITLNQNYPKEGVVIALDKVSLLGSLRVVCAIPTSA